MVGWGGNNVTSMAVLCDETVSNRDSGMEKSSEGRGGESGHSRKSLEEVVSRGRYRGVVVGD